MCGIAGFWNFGEAMDADESGEVLRRMTRALAHRGPDGEGYFQEASEGVALGHRRLAIIDLSPLGRQPMTSLDGRYCIVFNGEIYNHRRIRPQLEAMGCKFSGHSDTEVLLAAISTWGVAKAVSHCIGMFAFALWDRSSHTLTLARDRLGIKPLYFGWSASSFIFASELTPFRQMPDFDAQMDRNSICLFLRHSYIPAPYSIYSGVRKLMPGTILQVDREFAAQPRSNAEIKTRTTIFWSMKGVAESRTRNRLASDPEDALSELEQYLGDAVELRMEADVPLGAFLSGGVDSSTVAALMQARSIKPVRTFSIGFYEDGFDEAQHARAVAAHLGTDHTELYVTSNQALEVIPKLPSIYDEPFADSSQIPTFLVSQMARRDVTVALSGDGGDELFCGYDRYFLADRLWRQLDSIPGMLRRSGAAMLRATPAFWSRFASCIMPLLPANARVKNPRDKIARVAELLALESFDAHYRKIVSHWQTPEREVITGFEAPTALTDPARRGHLEEALEYMMYTDTVSYLPDDILTKVDRASMAVSLEARVPILDHRVVEFAWKLSIGTKVHSNEGKWLLKQLLYKYVPQELVDRPKRGFGVPIGEWLRGPLRDWAENLLDGQRLDREGFFKPEGIRRKWEQHLARECDNHYYLWDVLMFQAWAEENLSASRSLDVRDVVVNV